jgi:SAM-dependent methyltransferase
VLCHAGDKPELFAEIGRCLKPGGVFVFSDIMGADSADEAALRAFTDRNATTALGRPSTYLQLMADARLRYMAWWDNSHHLERYFRRMLYQIETHAAEMLAAGISDAYLANWRTSLADRADTQGASLY